tara:strand:- start:84 stop:542 length:459 start_codon:yes stop_codon:yes gene_type:complete
MNKIEDLYKQLSLNAITIGGSKDPIAMKDFLRFLSVKTSISRSNLGKDSGWTERYNQEENLVITSGTLRGVEYLDSIQFGERLQNRYNNYVTPFYIFHLMNSAGKSFFKKYYVEEIRSLVESAKENVVKATNQLKKEKMTLKNIEKLSKRLI